MEEAKHHQSRVENMEYKVNHIQMIKDNNNIDNKMAVNNYLVQNIK